MTRDDRSPLWERFKAKFHLKDYPAKLRASRTRFGAFHRPRFLQRFRRLPASSMAVPQVVRRARSPEIIELLDASSNHPNGPRDNEARGFGGLELPNDLAAGDFRFDVNAFHLDGNAFADDNGPVKGSAALGEEAPSAFPMDRNEYQAPADDAEYLQHLMELPDIDQPPDPQPQPDPNPHKCSQPDCAAAFPSRHWLAQHERNTHAIQMDQHEIVDIPSDDEAEPDIHQSKAKCIDEVVAILPDISREHVLELFEIGVGTAAEQLVVYILDKEENGDRYPRAAKIQTAKRKRPLEDIEDVEKRYRAEARANPSPLAFVRTVLAHEFPESKMPEIDSALEKSGTHLFAAYQVLLNAGKDTDSRKSKRKSKAARALREYQAADFLAANLETTIQTLQAQGKADCVLVLEELRAARRVREEAEAEEENFNQAKATGATLDCGCCFGEYALNRMFHCSNEDDLHWFCATCCRRTVETEVGEMRYKVTCMSMDPVCTAGFSREQKKLFLSEHTFQLLERLEQQASIREAEIEGLESCPFCNYAAVMPPLAENKEFTCANPECEKVSCRACKAETHIPKSCEEQKKESGLSKRRIVEEAKSAALIRKCNKCQTPFIKEYGCNKMTCTKCRSLQCYVCSKTVTSYDHFNDQTRGGKTGNCPLFDTHQALDEGRVQEAEKKAVAQILAEDPDIDEEALKIHVSEAVKKAERDRRGREGAIYGNPYPYPAAVAQGAYGEMNFIERNLEDPRWNRRHGVVPPDQEFLANNPGLMADRIPVGNGPNPQVVPGAPRIARREHGLGDELARAQQMRAQLLAGRRADFRRDFDAGAARRADVQAELAQARLAARGYVQQPAANLAPVNPEAPVQAAAGVQNPPRNFIAPYMVMGQDQPAQIRRGAMRAVDVPRPIPVARRFAAIRRRPNDNEPAPVARDDARLAVEEVADWLAAADDAGDAAAQRGQDGRNQADIDYFHQDGLAGLEDDDGDDEEMGWAYQ